MQIRQYVSSDCAALAELFYQTVHCVNAKDYTPEQLSAWATGSVDLAAWDRSFQSHETLVAVEKGEIVGFGDMDASGYLDLLYVHKDHQHQGIATAICDRLERLSHAEKFTVHASITAKPFFAHRGYRVVRQQEVLRRNVALTNFIMEKGPSLTSEAVNGIGIYEAPERASLMQPLLTVWEASVRATHGFLSDAEVRKIRAYVPQALRDVPRLIVAEREGGHPIGFMGVNGQRLEMLFLLPEERGAGLGRRLLTYGIRRCGIREVTVNEQNPQAVGFYTHMGFVPYKRTDRDEAGDPYPLVVYETHMTDARPCASVYKKQVPERKSQAPVFYKCVYSSIRSVDLIRPCGAATPSPDDGKQHKQRRAAEKHTDQRHQLILIPRLGRLGIVRRNRQLLNLELPIQVTDRILKIRQCGRNVQGHIQVDHAAGVNGSQIYPIRQLRRLVGRRLKQIGLTVLANPQTQLGQERLRALLCTKGSHIQLDLDILLRIIADRDLLCDGISGHHILEIGEKIRRRIAAARRKKEGAGISGIRNRAIRKSRHRAAQEDEHHQRQARKSLPKRRHYALTPLSPVPS